MMFYSKFVSRPRVILLIVLAQVLLTLLYLNSAGWEKSIDLTKNTLGDIFSSKNRAQEQGVAEELPKDKWEGFQGVLVVAAMSSTDVTWLEKVRQENKWLPQIYNVEHPYEGNDTLTVLRNKGHEAIVYLTYIIDNYDSLPPYSMFIHGHRQSWHQELDIDETVRSIILSEAEKHGYINLRCDWYPSCPAELKLRTHDGVVWGPGVHREDAERAISQAWSYLFPHVEMPETIASQCCAQFVVTRQAIHRNQRESYITMRRWLLETELIDDVSGRVFEKLWAYIMTGNAINCPSPQSCACDFFGKCQKRKWPVPPLGLGPLPEDSRWP